MLSAWITVLAALATALFGLFGIVVAAALSFIAGIYLERQKSQEWLKQEQWNYKREIYQRLLSTVSDYGTLLQRGRNALDQDNRTLAEAITEDIEKLLLEIDRLAGLAKVYASDETMAALIELAKRLHVANQKASKAATKDELRKVVDEQMDAANSLLRQLAETAKSDLEF